MEDDQDIYHKVGGDQPFYDLVDAFYLGVKEDLPLRSLYPDDLGPGKQHLSWFLIQRFGGPAYFNERRGAPRLRMRHFSFPVTKNARDSWVGHMQTALESIPVFAPFQPLLLRYFEEAATFLINRDEDLISVEEFKLS